MNRRPRALTLPISILGSILCCLLVSLVVSCLGEATDEVEFRLGESGGLGSEDVDGDPCSGFAGDYRCEGEFDGRPNWLFLEEEPVPGISCLTHRDHPVPMGGTCPHFTVDTGPSEFGAFQADVEITGVGEFVLTEPDRDPITCRREEEGFPGEDDDVDEDDDDEEAADDRTQDDGPGDTETLMADATFCPSPENSFNASYNDCITFHGSDSPFAMTWSPFYRNCEATLSGDWLTMTCDMLGTLNARIEVAPPDGGVFLVSDRIFIVDQGTTVRLHFRRQ